MAEYIIAFSRLTIALIFFVSAIHKALDFRVYPSFESAYDPASQKTVWLGEESVLAVRCTGWQIVGYGCRVGSYVDRYGTRRQFCEANLSQSGEKCDS